YAGNKSHVHSRGCIRREANLRRRRGAAAAGQVPQSGPVSRSSNTLNGMAQSAGPCWGA
ncbi:hypothetical protein HAX54_040805, partial [Datura stramonium]|nr:hypothetical protein [Datura stramonium]